MKQLIIPPYLEKGDRIAIVSPSGIIEKEVVMKAAKMLAGEGYECCDRR